MSLKDRVSKAHIEPSVANMITTGCYTREFPVDLCGPLYIPENYTPFLTAPHLRRMERLRWLPVVHRPYPSLKGV